APGVRFEHAVYWPSTSSSMFVDARGPSTHMYSARNRPAAPTPTQLGTGGSELGSVIDTSVACGAMSLRDVLPSTMPQTRKPNGGEKLGVPGPVGSTAPARRTPDSPPLCDADMYANEA